MYRSDFGLNPYVSYAESFQGQAGFNVDGGAFKPLRGKQWEVGVKYQPPGKNMTLTASLFDMRGRKPQGGRRGQRPARHGAGGRGAHARRGTGGAGVAGPDWT